MAGEETVIREVLVEQKHVGNMAWNLITIGNGQAKLDAAVAGATVDGVVDYDKVGDAVTDAELRSGVTSLWKYLVRA
jgi:formaldehyde-activating enzyme involved in methanogenesis